MTTEDSWTLVISVIIGSLALYYLFDLALDRWLDRKLRDFDTHTTWDETDRLPRMGRALDLKYVQQDVDDTLDLYPTEIDAYFAELDQFYDQETDDPALHVLDESAAPYEPRPAYLRPRDWTGW